METHRSLLYLFLFTALCHTPWPGSRVLSPVHTSSVRAQIMQVARTELGVKEATGKNDGERIAAYLAYCELPSGNAWCAAFVSWCYGQVGLPEPRNPWSPALFPRARRLADIRQALPADVFGLYGASQNRIIHAGLVDHIDGNYLITLEGNSRNQVESRRRPLRTIYAIADWVSNLDREGGER